MDYRQDPPFAVQIELVEGCTLACTFCGVNGIREKPGNFKFMSLDMVAAVARQLAHAIAKHDWNPRIEFAMHGEPSMHDHLEEAVDILRRHLPKLSFVLFSNGSGFIKDPNRMDAVLEAGINTIGLDNYEHVTIVPRVMAGYGGKYPVYHYPEQKEHNLHSGRRIKHRDIVVIQDISVATTGNHSSLNTHCGGGMKPQGMPIAARCAKPFRELAIRWDGNVALCCNDFRGIYKIGNFATEGAQRIWQHPAMMAARKKLMVRDRNFGPCQWCNAKSMRVGLLPDHLGLDELPLPNDIDDVLIATACEGEAYTPPVRREWEQAVPMFNEVADRTYPMNILDAKGRFSK
jgi:radical SAM protein with 4Fe4S-binding SPASM domain